MKVKHRQHFRINDANTNDAITLWEPDADLDALCMKQRTIAPSSRTSFDSRVNTDGEISDCFVITSMHVRIG